jgi:predicted amidohydrolase YtcJ
VPYRNRRMILRNGPVYTMDPRLPRVSALAVAGGTIAGGVDVREGDRSQVSTERVDLDGRCVVPGFTDAHIHFLQWSLSLQQLDLRGTPSREAAIAAVAEAAPQGDGWLLGAGWHAGHWDREPDRSDLDAVAAGRPVLLWAHDHHTAWVSTAALDAAPVPEIEVVERDAAGQPTGLLREHAAWKFAGAISLPPPYRLDEIVRAGVREAHRRGVTGIHDYQRPAGLATWQRLHADRRLNLRVWASIPYERLDEALALELRTGLGDEWLRIGPVKGFADGTLGSRTAALLEPLDLPGEPPPPNDGFGVWMTEPAELADLATRAVDAGIATIIHAIGDAAVRTSLDILGPTVGRTTLTPRLEHVQLVADSDLGRFASLGVAASVQPVHVRSDAEKARYIWGLRAEARGYPFGRLARSGALVSFGTDAPVEPIDPWPGIACAVTRAAPDWPAGTAPFGPQDAISLARALRSACVVPALTAGEQDRGRLVAGHRADLVIVPAAALAQPVEVGGALWHARPNRVLVDGEVVFEA